MVVGVLALQGDFAEHIDMLSALTLETKEVRTVADLAEVDALVIPGGEYGHDEAHENIRS